MIKKDKIFNIFIITFITLLIVIIIEISSWVVIKNRGWPAPTPFISGKYVRALQDPCRRFIFDLQLGTIHDSSADCKPLNGNIRESFVHYKNNIVTNEKLIRIVASGGSTTDGFFQNYANGYTWPLLLNQNCIKNKIPCDILNGGVGGFSSSQELRKIFRDVTLLDPKPDIVVSLTGLNDMYNYDSSYELIYPYYNELQLMSLNSENFIRTDTNFKILPNSILLLKKIISLSGFDITRENINKRTFNFNNQKYVNTLTKAKFKTKGELWKHNIQLSKTLVESVGGQYFVFLQPALGLNQINIPKNTDANRAILDKLNNKKYINSLNKIYSELKVECKTLNYCFDISDLLVETGINTWKDIRHPNEKGNKIIADYIFSKIF